MERVLTDNGACYRSRAFAAAVAVTVTGTVHKRTGPYRPQTNGKAERFNDLPPVRRTPTLRRRLPLGRMFWCLHPTRRSSARAVELARLRERPIQEIAHRLGISGDYVLRVCSSAALRIQ